MEAQISEIRDTLTTLTTAISNIGQEVVGFKEALNALKDTMENKIDAMGKILENNTQELMELQAASDEQKTTLSALKSRNLELETEIKAVDKKCQDITLELHHQELRSRAFNIRIIGLPELNDESTLDLASQFLREKHLLKSEEQTHDCIETAHRVGRRASENKKGRPIIVRFFRRHQVFQILTEVRQNRVNQNTDIKIVKDRTKREMETRRRAYKQLEAAWDEGTPASINKDLQLVINGRLTPIDGNQGH